MNHTTTKTNLQEQVRRALAKVEDPEVPVSLVELGVIRSIEISNNEVIVTMSPTRLACPAKQRMEQLVLAAISELDIGLSPRIAWQHKIWNPGLVTKKAVASLSSAGYSDPTSAHTQCPYCGSGNVKLCGQFGGAVCKIPYSCLSCGSTFDSIRVIEIPACGGCK